MCIRKISTLKRILCVLSFVTVGIVLPTGYCQNAEPRGSFGTRSVAARRMDLLRDEEQQFDQTEGRFEWDASVDEEKTLNENTKNLSSGKKTTTNAAALDPSTKYSSTSTSSSSTSSAGTSGNRNETLDSGERTGELKARKKNRRTKEWRNVYASQTGRGAGGGGEKTRDNRIRVSRKRTRLAKRVNSLDGTKSQQRYPQGRKFRAERRKFFRLLRLREKNNRGKKRWREDRRGRQREDDAREEEENTAESKLKRRRPSDAPQAFSLGKFDNRDSNGRNSTGDISSKYLREKLAKEDDAPSDANFTLVGTASLLGDEQKRRNSSTARNRNVHATDNVERELSKQLEREIARSGMIGLGERILAGSPRREKKEEDDDDGDEQQQKERKEKSSSEVTNYAESTAKFGNSRYDAEKMLGYSRTDEDLPILDLENEVLERTMKDYNAYMMSNARTSTSNYNRRSPDSFNSPDDRSKEQQRFRERPIILWQDVERTVATTNVYQEEKEDNPEGDLSCINGTFVPAPLARHALIRYVKSSVPGHEYLEADYECAPGFYMVSSESRLLCRNREWIGQVPKCKVKQILDGVCAQVSCEHVCKETDGRAVCSCYKGFRLDAYKCIDINECEERNGGCEYKCVNIPGSYRCECPKGMKLDDDRLSCIDINECLLNNGHGPCQDTCRNFVGGYECSCDGLQDAILSSDNHTCQHAAPCSVNNAGCSHTCLSTMGRVFCLCPDGFMLHDDWKTCQDVDECAVADLQAEVCRYGCINTPGSYRCAEPTELKDQPAFHESPVNCPPGYEVSSAATCVDIDECAIDNGGCSEVCENTDGSFFCACNGDEKALSSDGKSCLDINNVACPPLNPAGRGYLMCSRTAGPKTWRGRGKNANRPGTKCFLKCPHGYQLHGEYELTCQSDGTWDGPKQGECVRYSKPRLECPKDVLAELPPGREEAFVTFDQPSTDLDWFRYVRSKPSWGTRLEANLRVGVHQVTFFARHPVSKKQASCVLRIVVKEGEAPKVKNCPKDIEVTGKNGTAITWTEPIFTDNVKITRISSNESPGRPFDVGGHRIEYEAGDEAGWSSKCVFTVVLRQQ